MHATKRLHHPWLTRWENKKTLFFISSSRSDLASDTPSFSFLVPSVVLSTKVLLGINAAIIAYGQTGSGKTHTMFGPGFDLHDNKTKKGAVWKCPIEQYGIIPRLFEDLFARSSMQANRYQVDLEVGFAGSHFTSPWTASCIPQSFSH